VLGAQESSEGYWLIEPFPAPVGLNKSWGDWVVQKINSTGESIRSDQGATSGAMTRCARDRLV
jgi:hypothetical protein